MKLGIEALRRIGRVIWPRHLFVSGEVGFADPAATGVFMGAFEALAGAFRLRHRICLSGDFTAESTVVRLKADARGSLSIARLSIPIIWLLLQKPIRAVIRDVLRKGD
jgi:hypothetical protein